MLRGVAEQVVHGHVGTQRGRPPLRRQQRDHRRGEVHAEGRHRDRGEHLGHRREPEPGRRRDRDPGRAVGQPEALLELDPARAGDHRDPGQVELPQPRRQVPHAPNVPHGRQGFTALRRRPGAQPAQRDRAAGLVTDAQAGLVRLGVPGQGLDPAALAVPAAGEVQQRRGPVGRQVQPGQRGPQVLGAPRRTGRAGTASGRAAAASPGRRPRPPAGRAQRVVVGQLLAQRRREPQREGGVRHGEQGRQLGRQPGPGAGGGAGTAAARRPGRPGRRPRRRRSPGSAGAAAAGRGPRASPRSSAVAARSRAGTTTRSPTVSTSPSAASQAHRGPGDRPGDPGQRRHRTHRRRRSRIDAEQPQQPGLVRRPGRGAMVDARQGAHGSPPDSSRERAPGARRDTPAG